VTGREYLEDSRRLSVGLLAISPLLALYEAGLLLGGSDLRNGADAFLRRAFLLALGPPGRYVFGAGILILLLGAAACAARERLPAHRLALPLAFEGLFFGAILGPLSLFLRGGLRALTSLDPDGPALRTLLAIGAGVYEELAFRLLLLSGIFVLARHLLDPLGAGRGVALAVALVSSSLLFAGFHNVGPYGEPFSWDAFAFRTVAGGVLGGLFVARGIAVAVYAHAFYDLLF
jgi:hypothetical protein